jgi:hypothetical protein
MSEVPLYRGTSLLRNCLPLGPYSNPMPRVLWWSQGGGGGSYERGTRVRLPRSRNSHLIFEDESGGPVRARAAERQPRFT